MTNAADQQASLEAVLKDEIIRMYEEVADDPTAEFHFYHGRPAAELFGYDPALLDRAPDGRTVATRVGAVLDDVFGVLALVVGHQPADLLHRDHLAREAGHGQDDADRGADAHRLWDLVNRPNLMIKVPATSAGIVAIEELIADGINVNAISPTFVDTPQVAMLLDDPDFKAAIINRIPLARVGGTDDLVGAAIFFCSDASSFITGQILGIDGGLTATQ